MFWLVLISTAFASPKDQGFYLDRTYRNTYTYENSNQDRLVYSMYKTSVPMDPYQIKEAHRIPLMEMSRNVFQSDYGIHDWKIKDYQIRHGKNQSTIVDISGTYINEKKEKRYFQERFYDVGLKHYHVAWSGKKAISKADAIIESVGPVGLVAARGVASEIEGVGALCASCDVIAEPLIANDAIEDLVDTTKKVSSKNICEQVPEKKRNTLTTKFGLTHNNYENFWDSTGGAILSCLEGFGHSLVDVAIGIKDLAVMGAKGVKNIFNGNAGSSLGEAIFDYAEKHKDTLADKDGKVSFFTAVMAIRQDMAVRAGQWAKKTLDETLQRSKELQVENEKNWKTKLDKEELSALNRVYSEYIATSSITALNTAIAEKAWSGIQKTMGPLLNMVWERVQKDYGELFDCLSNSEQSKFICQTAGNIIEAFGGAEFAIAKAASGTLAASKITAAAKLAAREFLDAPVPMLAKGNQAIEDAKTVARLEKMPDKEWRRIPTGEQVALVDGSPVARHIANEADAVKQKFSYTVLGNDKAYKGLAKKLSDKKGSIPSVRVSREKNPYAWNAKEESAKDYIKDLSNMHLTKLPNKVEKKLSSVFEKNPEYANDFGQVMHDLNLSADKQIVKESSRVFERLSKAISQSSEKDLPSLDLLKQAIKDGDKKTLREVGELYEKVAKRVDAKNAAAVKAKKAPAAKFDEELNLLAKEKLGNRYPSSWEESRSCLVGR